MMTKTTFPRATSLLLTLALIGCGAASSSDTEPPSPDAEVDSADADGDLISDVDEGRASSVDTDHDGVPDYLDRDSDNDTILDLHERQVDPDGDHIPAFRDTDSDGDCRSDTIEAGDADLASPPQSSDHDGRPDFLDQDSDDDGLPDGTEDANCDGQHNGNESSPTDDDSDNDGVSDLVENVAGTNPNNNTSNPQANGDFFFLVPYKAPASPASDRLNFATAFRHVDVYFQIDVSASMADELASIRQNLAKVIRDITCAPGEDPVTKGCVPDLQTGVGSYGGHIGVDPDLWHLKDISATNLTSQGLGSTEAKLPTSATAWGNEQHLGGLDLALQGTCASDPTRLGRACYRASSLRLLVQVTDEQYSEDVAFKSGTHQPIVDRAVAGRVQMIGVYSNSDNLGSLVTDMAGLASAATRLVPVLGSYVGGTPACNALGANPFSTVNDLTRAIVRGDGAASANAITCAVQMVVRYVSQDVGSSAKNDPSNVDAQGAHVDEGSSAKNDPSNVDAQGAHVDAVASFVRRLEAHMDGTTTCPNYPQVNDTNGDAVPDQFGGVLPGKKLCWKLFVKDNDLVKAAPKPQLFHAIIEISGQSGALLDARDVYFLVPPEIVELAID